MKQKIKHQRPVHLKQGRKIMLFRHTGYQSQKHHPAEDADSLQHLESLMAQDRLDVTINGQPTLVVAHLPTGSKVVLLIRLGRT
jgi:hypothetical protein